MRTWKAFFNDLGEFFLGREAPDKMPSRRAGDFWRGERASCVADFCAPTQKKSLLIQRQIYIEEGSRAWQKAEGMNFAVNSSAEHYFIYKLRYDEYEKYKILNKLRSTSTFNLYAEDVHDFLLREALRGAQMRLRDQIIQISPLLYGRGVQYQEAGVSLSSAVENYLEARVAWELKNPEKTFVGTYVSPDTVYAAFVSARAKILMPNFSNTIEVKNLFRHPLISLGYGVDGFRKIFFDYPARAISWVVNKITFGKKVLRVPCNIILGGPFVVADVICFAGAKVCAGKVFDKATVPVKIASQKKAPRRTISKKKKSITTDSPRQVHYHKKAATPYRTHKQKQ
jgi:hypothetical protein